MKPPSDILPYGDKNRVDILIGSCPFDEKWQKIPNMVILQKQCSVCNVMEKHKNTFVRTNTDTETHTCAWEGETDERPECSLVTSFLPGTVILLLGQLLDYTLQLLTGLLFLFQTLLHPFILLF